jgi:hypothetical protein
VKMSLLIDLLLWLLLLHISSSSLYIVSIGPTSRPRGTRTAAQYDAMANQIATGIATTVELTGTKLAHQARAAAARGIS